MSERKLEFITPTDEVTSPINLHCVSLFYTSLRWSVEHSIITLFCFIIMVVTPVEVCAQSDVPISNETPSQMALSKMLADIQRCNKSVRYTYDVESRTISPNELVNIHKFKLNRISHGIAVFHIDESYEGIPAKYFWIATSDSWARGMFSVAFDGNYEQIRQRLEKVWGIRFIEKVKPGPDIEGKGQYAESETKIKGKRYVISIQSNQNNSDIPTHLIEVGCNEWDN